MQDLHFCTGPAPHYHGPYLVAWAVLPKEVAEDD